MKYLRVEEVIDFHDLLIKKYGGLNGIRDLGLLSSAIAMPAQQYNGKDLHQTVHEKAAAYMYHIIKNHPFSDGNKRTGVLACLIFLDRNGESSDFSENYLEYLAIATASGQIDKTDLSILLKRANSIG